MSNLSELQKQILFMLKNFHDFCQQNDLVYYALGGTMLGAMRHHGFIPWDDDADVGMPRRDYDRLAVLLKNQMIEGRYKLETTASPDPLYTFPYSKLYDIETTLIENTKDRIVRGISIDIFPLDGLGDTADECRQNYKKIQTKLTLLNLRKIKISQNRSRAKNILLKIVQMIPKGILSEKRLSVEIDKLCQCRDFDGCKMGGNLVGAWGFREVMPRSVFGVPALYTFEDMEIYGPENGDLYLANQYGDWRKLPPKEKQVSHHDRFLDLNIPYSKYKD